MESTRIQNGQTERIEVIALDSSGVPVTGLNNALLGIRRISDDFWLDFDDVTFKNSSWTTRQEAMTEIDATNDAGKFKYDFVTTGFSDDTYKMRADCASAENFPQLGELKVGDYVDNLDAAVSSRTVAGDLMAFTPTAMSSLSSLIFTNPLSKYEGDAGRNLVTSLAILRNRVDFSGNTMQVKKSDDSTNFWTASTSGDNTAKPIVAKDPT